MHEPLRNHCLLKGGTGFPEVFQGKKEGDLAFIKVSDMSLPGNERRITVANNYVDESTAIRLGANVFPARSTVFAKVGAALLLNRRRMLTAPTIIDNNMMAAIPTEADPDFLFHFLCSVDFANYVQMGALPSINQSALGAIPFPKLSTPQQRRIAEILSTLDEAIAQTEALIAKHQQIKAGLMHDLFTRGVTPDGHLRPTREQAPDLYKESPLGWIPKEWALKSISSIADSLVDGPFGSNLKTEHYVIEPGVRVVRLQNIQEGYYNDLDPVFVSQRHADYLVRNAVNPGDVLIAALGDESYPVGRACCYPAELPPAINKADCFRLRCHAELAINTYVMHLLNTAAARNQVKRFEQGVTRRRTNLGNLRRVIAALPSLDEQKCIIQRLAVAGEQISTGGLQVENLRQQKHGLMHDLLTGKVHVKPDSKTLELADG